MPERSRPALLARRAVAWSIAWAFSAALYLLLIDITDLPELIVGARGHDVALWPGGERDSLRPWVTRDQATLAGRKGFVRLAIPAGVPIVPIATVGGPDAMPVMASGRRLAKALRLDELRA